MEGLHGQYGYLGRREVVKGFFVFGKMGGVCGRAGGLSLGTVGCNFTCQFCQNHNLAQDVKGIAPSNIASCAKPDAAPCAPHHTPKIPGKELTPAALVNAALQSGARSLSYTYSEPTVFFELTLKTAALACEQGLQNILVSNGYQSPLAMKHLKDFIQAANFDLKAFSNDFYRDLCGASLAPVLDNLKRAADYGWWLEITTLLIPTLNDNPDELFKLATFIHDELGPDVPWHVSRYRPAYNLSIAPTPVKTLEMAVTIGKEAGLNYVYAGNLPAHTAENTYCPACQTLLVQRRGFEIEIHSSGACPACNQKIPGEGWT